MNNPVEIEFAVDTNKEMTSLQCFNLLQIRPIVVNDQGISFKIDKVNSEEIIIFSEKALGNGVYSNISDLVYIRTESFKSSDNPDIAKELEKINGDFVKSQHPYVLIGPGRWGSSDPWLGIPVKWANISAARIIVEQGIENYKVDPSQGTHFFHNLTTFGVGYLTINPFINEGIYNVDYLNHLQAVYENRFLRHIRFMKPLKIEIDGKTNKAVIYKPFISDKPACR
jgi:hypothetical protein